MPSLRAGCSGSPHRHGIRGASGVADRLRRREDLKPWVHRVITYFTAWRDEEGSTQFRDDVYGHDARLAQALEAREGKDMSAALP